MAEPTQKQNHFYDESADEIEAREPRGFENKEGTITATEHGARLDFANRVRDLALCLPHGRALDEEHLAVLIDSGNETSKARILRARLVEYAAKAVRGAVILSDDEAKALTSWYDAKGPERAECGLISSWPRSS